jgi:O-antigen/teichoic acid export membrane protein
MDQGLFAASNFTLTVLLARWLTIEDYGAFTVAYAVFWFFGSFHTALLSEPMTVYGPGKFRDRLSVYMGILLYGSFGYGILSSLILLMLSLYFKLSGDSKVLSSALLGLALAAPFILFQWLMRRACYVYLKPQFAALAGAMYMAMTLVGIYVLNLVDGLSPTAAFGLMGFTSLATGSWLAMRLRVGRPSLKAEKLSREAISTHWEYGRWSAPTTALGTVSESSYYLLLPIWGGLAASAVFRALMNLVLPVLHAITALSMFLLPNLVQARGSNEFKRLMRLGLLLFLLGSGLYWIMLGVFHYPLVSWLYGGRYIEYANLLWLVGLIPLARAVLSVFGEAIRALERPDRVFLAQVLCAAVVLTAGLGLMVVWEAVGAILAYLAAQATMAAALVWLWISRDKQESTGSPGIEEGGRDRS